MKILIGYFVSMQRMMTYLMMFKMLPDLSNLGNVQKQYYKLRICCFLYFQNMYQVMFPIMNYLKEIHTQLDHSLCRHPCQSQSILLIDLLSLHMY